MKLFNKLFGYGESGRPSRSPGLDDGDHERAAAAKLLDFLAERHVLYREVNERCPRGVVRSARKIRSELRRRFEHLDPGSRLGRLVEHMRASIHDLLDSTCRDVSHPKTCDDCTISVRGCASELLQFRRTMGVEIQALCLQFKLIPPACLQGILPAEGRPAPTCGISPKLLGSGDQRISD